MEISEIMNSLAMIFIMIIPGIIFSKKNMISENQSKGIAAIVVNLTWPCLVIDAMQIAYSEETLHNSVYIFAIIMGTFALALFLSLVHAKIARLGTQKAYLFAFMLVFANTGLIGLPVINVLYGKKALFYASIIEALNDIFLFTAGIILIQLSAGSKSQLSLRGLLTPGMFGILLGLVMFLLRFQLPDFMGESVRLIGMATTPLSMLLIGLQMGHIDLRKILGDIHLYLLSIMKLIVVPAAVILLLRFGLGDISLLSKVIIMQSAMPTAACSAIFSQQYESDVDFSTKGVLLTTIFSIITIPVIAVFLEL